MPRTFKKFKHLYFYLLKQPADNVIDKLKTIGSLPVIALIKKDEYLIKLLQLLPPEVSSHEKFIKLFGLSGIRSKLTTFHGIHVFLTRLKEIARLEEYMANVYANAKQVADTNEGSTGKENEPVEPKPSSLIPTTEIQSVPRPDPVTARTLFNEAAEYFLIPAQQLISAPQDLLDFLRLYFSQAFTSKLCSSFTYQTLFTNIKDTIKDMHWSGSTFGTILTQLPQDTWQEFLKIVGHDQIIELLRSGDSLGFFYEQLTLEQWDYFLKIIQYSDFIQDTQNLICFLDVLPANTWHTHLDNISRSNPVLKRYIQTPEDLIAVLEISSEPNCLYLLDGAAENINRMAWHGRNLKMIFKILPNTLWSKFIDHVGREKIILLLSKGAILATFLSRFKPENWKLFCAQLEHSAFITDKKNLVNFLQAVPYQKWSKYLDYLSDKQPFLKALFDELTNVLKSTPPEKYYAKMKEWSADKEKLLFPFWQKGRQQTVKSRNIVIPASVPRRT